MPDKTTYIFLLTLITVLPLCTGITPPQPTLKPLGQNAWLLTGSYFDEHMTVVDTSAGLVVVDTLTTAAATERGMALLRKQTTKPVKFVINTHFDIDHYGGNQLFPEAVIIGHVNCRNHYQYQFFDRQENKAEIKNLLQSLPVLVPGDDPVSRGKREAYASWYSNMLEGFEDFTFTPPNLFFSENLSINAGDIPIELMYFGPGHTDADLVVLFPEEKILITGDLVLGEKTIPVVHAQLHGGSLTNLIKILEQIEKLTIRYPTVVAGHGTYTGPEVIQDQKAYLNKLIKTVQKARESGLSLEEAKKTITMDEYRDYWLYEFAHQGNIETAWHEGSKK
ncbi:MAG: MBL fold metallo-hydrolase [Candidatus Aminicenantes bacterium]|nr:MBL fold metallo-hydrolase [Candidatus Aminicenantes bacterium]